MAINVVASPPPVYSMWGCVPLHASGGEHDHPGQNQVQDKGLYAGGGAGGLMK